jgi:ethanolamine kinase
MDRPSNGHTYSLPYVDLAYDHKDSEKSAKELVFAIQSKWRDNPDQVQIVQFKDGITNTVRPIDREARAPY